MTDWQGHKGPLGRNRTWTSAELPGVEVRHCGHPTANYPYYVAGVARLSGRTWRTLAEAQAAAIEAHMIGEEPGAEGRPQLVMPGVAPIGDRQRMELRGRRPLRGGNAPPPAGGLFDLDARAQGDLLDKP